MDFIKYITGVGGFWAALALLISSANAATYERPSGGYTPTNHSANITKYQIDSAAHTAISSLKVDGDFNKAFQALNELDARTAPSPAGNSGLFLTNDGTSTFWSGISTSQVISATAGIYSTGDISATGRTITGAVLSGTTLYINTSARLGTISTTGVISTTSLYSAGDITLGGLLMAPNISTTGVSGTVSASNVNAKNVSASTVTADIVSAGTVVNPAVPKAWLNFGGTSACSVSASFNISGCTKIAATTGVYAASFTTPVSGTYAVICTNLQDNWASIYRAVQPAPTGTGFIVQSRNTSGNSDVASGGISCVVFGL